MRTGEVRPLDLPAEEQLRPLAERALHSGSYAMNAAVAQLSVTCLDALSVARSQLQEAQRTVKSLQQERYDLQRACADWRRDIEGEIASRKVTETALAEAQQERAKLIAWKASALQEMATGTPLYELLAKRSEYLCWNYHDAAVDVIAKAESRLAAQEAALLNLETEWRAMASETHEAVARFDEHETPGESLVLMNTATLGRCADDLAAVRSAQQE